MSWFAQIAASLYDVSKGVAALAAGNVVVGFAEFSAAGFGLISKGLESDESGDDQAEKLTEIDTKLGTLIVSVQSIASQTIEIEQQVADLAATELNVAAMNSAMSNAKFWLDSYYTNKAGITTSREWARWTMAGCDLKADTCSSADHPVTADSLAAFRSTYMTNPAIDSMTNAWENFPLWWAFSVYGNQTVHTANYTVGGFLASQLEDHIYSGLTDNKGTAANGLLSFMNHLMSSSTCFTDVTYPQCDLYTSVYLPLESYFQLAISRQSQLVMAQAEADTVLAQFKPKIYLQAGDVMMDQYKKRLNEEVEVFLQVAEQIALYRAADGRTDWTNFASTDAGRLLTRADFIAMQLAGNNYRTASTTPQWTEGYVNPPWPSDGIVGRVFYAKDETQLADTATRSVCSNANPSSCTHPLTQLGENQASLRDVTGVQQPYLQWARTVDDEFDVVTMMTGTANTQWTVKRLTPMAATTLPVVDTYYLVNSTQAATRKATYRMPAPLTFKNYDQNFVTPPGPDTRPVIPTDNDGNLIPWVKQFGSFSSVEGAVGRYGLKLDTGSFKASTDMPAVVYSSFYSASQSTPGAVSYGMRYLPNPSYGHRYGDGYGGVNAKGTWTATTVPVKLVMPPEIKMRNVKLNWPSTLKVNLSSDARSYFSLYPGGFSPYGPVNFKQEILSNGTTIKDVLNQPCSSLKVFTSCQTDKDLPVDVAFAMGEAADMSINLKANFDTSYDQLYEAGSYDSGYYYIQATSIDPSTVDWVIQTPLLTLTR